jgi:hypothetical protein
VANTQAQFGFKHIGYLGGGAPDYQLRTYAISSSNTTAIGFGDPVGYVNTTSPFITQYTATLATGTLPMVGIFQGCQLIPSGGGAPVWSNFWPGAAQGANGTAYVIDAPNAQFLVAALNTAITSANIGNLISFASGSAATTGAGFSIATLDQSTATSTGTTTSVLPFRVIGLYPGVGNGSDPTTPFNWVICSFNFQMNRSFAG